MNHQRIKVVTRRRRTFRVRKRLHGSSERPRLSIFRSHKHIYAQVIDDAKGKTLAAASTADGESLGGLKYGGNKKAAEAACRKHAAS